MTRSSPTSGGPCASCGRDHAPGACQEAATVEALRQIEHDQRVREHDRAVRLVTTAFAPYTRPSRLIPGPGHGRERAQANQRRRIYFGLAEAIRRNSGWDAVTVAKIIEYAGVSRRAFYELFTDKSDCLRRAAESVEENAGDE